MDPITIGVGFLGAYLAGRYARDRQYRDQRYAMGKETRECLSESFSALAQAQTELEAVVGHWELDDAAGTGQSVQGAQAAERFSKARTEVEALWTEMSARLPPEKGDSFVNHPALLLQAVAQQLAPVGDAVLRYRAGGTYVADQAELDSCLSKLVEQRTSLSRVSQFNLRIPAGGRSAVQIDWSQLKRLGRGDG